MTYPDPYCRVEDEVLSVGPGAFLPRSIEIRNNPLMALAGIRIRLYWAAPLTLTKRRPFIYPYFLI
jgi:hypothetical protein